jgi:hypothetical protein
MQHITTDHVGADLTVGCQRTQDFLHDAGGTGIGFAYEVGARRSADFHKLHFALYAGDTPDLRPRAFDAPARKRSTTLDSSAYSGSLSDMVYSQSIVRHISLISCLFCKGSGMLCTFTTGYIVHYTWAGDSTIARERFHAFVAAYACRH